MLWMTPLTGRCAPHPNVGGGERRNHRYVVTTGLTGSGPTILYITVVRYLTARDMVVTLSTCHGICATPCTKRWCYLLRHCSATGAQIATAATFSAASLEAVRMLLASLERPDGSLASPIRGDLSIALPMVALLLPAILPAGAAGVRIKG